MNMPGESGEYDVEKILEAAEMDGIAGENQLLEKLNDSDSGVRYWAITGLMRLDKLSSNTKESLTGLLDDPSPSVQIAAAEILCSFGSSSEALETLGKNVMDERPWVSLQLGIGYATGNGLSGIMHRFYDLENNPLKTKFL